MTDSSASRSTSRLAEAQSPFLRHGAEQPVDWWPWGDDAFRFAREQDRPVLLDIGAVWCHWCHVMDRESYENAETAALINELFVPIKVDRDERPDVDARYQRAVQVLTGQGGWPLTAFLTPEGEVFYGGTYFPPDERYGRPSFRRVLGEVARIWREERKRALEAARGINERLLTYAETESQAGQPRPDLLDLTFEELAGSFDFRWGGFGRAPKFPNAGALDLLLDRVADGGPDWARRMLTETLDAMACGGIVDQIGGGFHRYSTDARWIIPHFEKMGYDNGPLLATYATAYALTGSPLYADVAKGIIGHYRDIAPDLVAAGGFPASQDADIGPHDDGEYWTWTEAEIEVALGNDIEAAAARLRYGLDDPAGAMNEDPDRHVLFLARSVGEVARALERDPAEMTALLARVRARLKAARDRRPAPYVDRSLYSGWTALVASGHLAAARYLDAQAAGQAALRALERTWAEAFRPLTGVLHRLGDAASGELLEDQAYLTLACLDALEYTQDAKWRERAVQLATILLERFRDPMRGGGFVDRPADAPAPARPLERAHMPMADAPTPSGNGAAALAFARLAALTGEARFHEAAEGVLRAFAGSAERLLSAAATWMKALAWMELPVTHIVVVDNVPDARASELLRAALAIWRPRTLVRWLPPGGDAGALPPELQAMLTTATPRAYLCAGQTCAAPVARADELVALMKEFRPAVV